MAIYRTTIVGNQDGQTIEVNHGWVNPFTPGGSDALTLAEGVYSAWSAYMIDDLVDDYQVTSVRCISMDNPAIGVEFTESVAGSSTGAPLPMFCVGNVELTTGLRGRSYRGRFGIPGLPKTLTDPDNGNVLAAAAVTLLQGNVSDFIGNVQSLSVGVHLAVISEVSGGLRRLSPIATQVTTAAVKAPLGTRVSRKG